MSYLIFKNELGELTFSGDGSSPLVIREITGLGTPDKIYQTREYLDFDGQSTISSKFAPRIITISFDICGEDISAHTANVYRVLSKPGTLYTYFVGSNRRITVNQISVDSFVRHGSRFRSLVAQLICDNPYFADHIPVSFSCYETGNNLKYDPEADSWHLDTPTVWGIRINDKPFMNSGDIRTYPVFSITSYGDASSSNGFEILRVNPDNPSEIIQRFCLNYAMSDEETVTICFDSRMGDGRRFVSSSSGKSLLNYRSEDSSLSNFWIDPGENRIIFNNLSEGNTISASVFYENQYVEGVY